MNSKQLFSKTMPFVWVKLALGGATVLISAILLAIFMGLGWLFGETAMVIMFVLWISATGVVRFAIMHYAGYLVKAGHIAVIAEAFATGQIPADQVEYGKAVVTQRFVSSNIYFAVDELVTGAVKEIQKGIGKVGNALDFIPGIEAVAGLAQFFVSISLGYIDECCLGWTFLKKEQDTFKSAADGVVIYAQNWKVLLKDAAKTMLKTLLLTMVLALIIFVPIGLVFKILKWSGLAAFLLACLIAWVVKFAVMDSYIMIEMMSSYLTLAPATVITFDLYSKLAGISSKFKELWNKAGEASPKEAVSVSTAGTQYSAEKPLFCGQCGAKNDAGTKFCGSCGSKL
ncbi:MAG: zinc ribbon domain-containing protein [Ruminococcaceae bacterium]|nr:zinc ribbon domain-containing protein [Oscillospiraceae bacterium]MBQ9969568.1 zinc ribbon domain-containing protein [Oscillospiraceae bacterium]